MSYARFFDPATTHAAALAAAGLNLPTSDVYVFADVAEILRCCGCRLTAGDEPQDFFTILTARMVEHLAAHTAAGHTVPETVVPEILADYPDGIVPQTRGEHGGFSLCPERCPLCEIVGHEAEEHWRARVGSGLVTVDLSAMSTQERAEHDAACRAADEAAEMRAACDPDGDRERDGWE